MIKFDIVDLEENLDSAGTGSDILRFINANNMKFQYIYIHEKDKEIRTKMILLVKNYNNSKIQLY